MADLLTAPTATADRATVPGALPVSVAGIGVCLPPQVVTNHDWAARLDTTDEWIRTRTGIRERRRAAPEQATSDLAVQAGAAALADAGVDARDLTAVVLATTTPDHVIPQTAPAVAARLGTLAPAFDIGAGCSGFVYGLAVAGALATGPLGGPVLLVGAETLTRWIDPTRRDTAVLFGDGAGAVVLGVGGDGWLGPFDLGADGGLRSILEVPAGGTRRPTTHRDLDVRANYLVMDGREVYRHAVTGMTRSSTAVLGAAGLGPGEIDLFVGHQANARILEAVAARLGIDRRRAFLSIERYGNTSAASIPIALAEARDGGHLHPGDRVLLTAFGAGLTWGSCLLGWTAAGRAA